jgi:Fe-S oxidoreductase
VFLWDDTWVRYHEPVVGRAAVAVLERLGFEVRLVEGRVCCGRPAASRGLLDAVRRAADHNLRLLAGGSEPIVFLEPSCWSMFKDEYTQLGFSSADDVAERCMLFEQFIASHLDGNALAESLEGPSVGVALHGHCHAKALADRGEIMAVLDALPRVDVRWLETGCCGMAGAFGMLSGHRQLSREVAEPLVNALRELPSATAVVASGTSCRHQIAGLTDRRALHIAEFMATYLDLEQ